jgi:hypothetical protein
MMKYNKASLEVSDLLWHLHAEIMTSLESIVKWLSLS